MIGQQLLVVADAHLNPAHPADEDAFLAFLDEAPRLGDALLLAGDIYDFWFTYRRLVPRDCMRVTARIIEVARHMPVAMLGGNHDRWGGTFWSATAGVAFDPRRLRFAVGERRVMAVHGDGLHEERWSAAMLNRVLDTRLVIGAFDLLPPALGLGMARALAHVPSDSPAHRARVDVAAARQATWAERELRAEPDIDLLVMGHTHREALREFAPGRWYLNPGPWLVEHRYASVTMSGVTLATFG